MTLYTVDEVFEILKQQKITTHKESVRRWLRSSTLKGTPPSSRKEGWKVEEEDLLAFIQERVPENATIILKSNNTTDVAKESNATNVANSSIDEEAIREKMWYQLTKERFLFEGFVEIKKSQVRESIMHLKGSKKFFDYVWEHIQQHTKAYKNPRVNYLLDAFLYDGKRIKFDENYSSLEEKILFALIKYIRQKKISSN